MTQTIVEVIGYASNAVIADRLHNLGHDDAVEYIILQREDTLRHRLRVSSQSGNEYLIALPRDQQLLDGAVLVLEPEHALVVRMAEEQWLCLLPSDLPSAVELGYFVGNLHWRVKF
ncbi:MAG: urease accessory protein UreE, partial [Gammaproteobacteria bacterium]|nr:urease accessory protein UreE [Gammaproteobacteria bacterium]